MENPITAPASGTAGEILVTVGQSLAAGTLLTALALEEVAA
jgi:biotin carboxyl carrier protein